MDGSDEAGQMPQPAVTRKAHDHARADSVDCLDTESHGEEVEHEEAGGLLLAGWVVMVAAGPENNRYPSSSRQPLSFEAALL